MSELKVFENELFKVSAKAEGEQILFDVEHVAKSLGFTESKGNKLYVRWRTVNSYLQKYLSQDVAKGDLIPEPLVYKLAFKASNEIAEKFQNWLAMEVIPSIRKHGMYAKDELLDNPDLLIEVATRLKEEREARMELEAQAKADKPKVLFANAVEVSETSILIGELSKLLRQNGVNIGQNRLFEWMRENSYLIKKRGESYNLPTQKAMDLELFEIKKRVINNPDGSIRTTRTPKVTGKGQIYFISKFLNEEERTCQNKNSSAN